MSSHEKVELVFSKSDDGAVRVEARRGEVKVGLTSGQVMELFGKEAGEVWEKVKRVFVDNVDNMDKVDNVDKNVSENTAQSTLSTLSTMSTENSINFASSNEEKVALFFRFFAVARMCMRGGGRGGMDRNRGIRRCAGMSGFQGCAGSRR